MRRACAAIAIAAIAGRAALRVQPPAAAPLFLALRAAAHALWRARIMACFSGSALSLRALSLELRLWPAALHAFEQ